MTKHEHLARMKERLVILARWVLIVYCVAALALLWHLFGGGPAPSGGQCEGAGR